MPIHHPGRRAVVLGAPALGVAALTVGGCSVTDDPAAPAAPAGGALGAAADVPVGGATIFADQSVVVTQATEGEFAAFSSICPHQNCNVGSVEGAEIICPCHGSRFDLTGAVLTGPATSGLAPRTVTVDGGQLTLES